MSSVDGSERSKIVRAWHAQHELILKQWGEICACYRYMHYKSHQQYRRTNMQYTFPIIILSTITGTANFAQSSFPDEIKAYFPAIVGTLNLVAAIMTTLMQFLKVSEMVESHRVSSIHYGKMSRTIRLELSLPITERNYDGHSMVEMMYSEFNRLIEQSPPIPSNIISRFDRRFKDDNKLTKPEISDISPIKPFDNNKEIAMIHHVLSKFRAKPDEDVEIGSSIAEMKEIALEDKEGEIRPEEIETEREKMSRFREFFKASKKAALDSVKKQRGPPSPPSDDVIPEEEPPLSPVKAKPEPIQEEPAQPKEGRVRGLSEFFNSQVVTDGINSENKENEDKKDDEVKNETTE
jgi:hypothetical protein